MTRDVQKLIVDYLRRVPWWAWPVVAAFHGAGTFFYVVGVNSGLRNIGAIGSYMLVTSLQNRAWLRVVSSLPLARRDIWHAQWWIGIGGPGLMFTGLDCLIVLGAQPVADPQVDLWHVALWMTNTWAALGVLVLSTGSLYRFSERFRWTPLIIILVILVYVYMLVAGWPTDGPGLAATLVAGVIGLVGGIVAYVWPALLAPVSPAKVATPAQVSIMSASNQSGWVVLAAMHVRSTLVFAGVLGVNVLAMRLAWEGTFPVHTLFGVVFVVSAITSFLPWLVLPISAARTFRSLPLSIDRLIVLAGLGGLVPAACLLLGGLAAGGMSLSELGSLLPLVLTVLALQALIVPIKLRTGETKGTIVFTVFFMLAGVISAVFIAALDEEPWWLAPLRGSLDGGFVLSVIIATIGFLWARHELGAGRNAYLRASPSPLVPASFSGGPGTLSA